MGTRDQRRRAAPDKPDRKPESYAAWAPLDDDDEFAVETAGLHAVEGLCLRLGDGCYRTFDPSTLEDRW